MDMSSRILATLLATAVMATAAGAQTYREGMPEVLQGARARPSAGAADAATASAFRTAYQRRKSPRMVVFWNRQLTDSLSNSYEEWARVSLNDDRSVDRTRYYNGSEANYSREASAEMRSGRSAASADGQRMAGLPERADWRAAQGFNRTMLAGGARLIDRNLIMRSTALRTADKSDAQSVEMSALEGKADLLVEVLQTPDASAPSGYTFRVDVKDIRSGTLLANVVTQGVPMPTGPGRFVATDAGYQRERPAPPSVDQVGARVAAETMQAMMANWR